MTPKEFVRIFNANNARDRAKLFIDHDLKEAQVNMLITNEDPAATFSAFVFSGYLKVESAICYAIRRSDEKRIIIGAFRMYADGEKTFNEWMQQCPHKPWAMRHKKIFIETFEGAVMPEYMKS